MLAAACPAILAIPSGHRYVQQIRPIDWRLIPDPTDPWWPHPALEPEFLRSVQASVDLVHLHFGFEHRRTSDLVDWLDCLDALALPLVFTVHDIHNPHLADNAPHEEHLSLLLARATTVLTLTPCAADAIAHRTARPAEVIAHPPMYEATPPEETEPGLVGVTFKNRPSAFGRDLLAPIAAAARDRGGRVQARFDAVAAPSATPPTADVRAVVEVSSIDDPLDDDAFASHLAHLQVAVLPYRFGTHSGWLEACRDLGTRVVAPSTGCYQDQWDDVICFDPAPDRWAASVGRAVGEALDLDPVTPPSPRRQRERLASVRAAHAEVYRHALQRVHR